MGYGSSIHCFLVIRRWKFQSWTRGRKRLTPTFGKKYCTLDSRRDESHNELGRGQETLSVITSQSNHLQPFFSLLPWKIPTADTVKTPVRTFRNPQVPQTPTPMQNAHPTPVNFHPPPPHPLPHRLSYVFPYADAGVAEILLPGGGGLPALTALTALGCGECPGKNLSSAGNSLLYPVYASASCLGAC